MFSVKEFPPTVFTSISHVFVVPAKTASLHYSAALVAESSFDLTLKKVSAVASATETS